MTLSYGPLDFHDCAPNLISRVESSIEQNSERIPTLQILNIAEVL